jgi:hypothetical protein
MGELVIGRERVAQHRYFIPALALGTRDKLAGLASRIVVHLRTPRSGESHAG